MIRLAIKEDLNNVMKIINDAKTLFKQDGSNQWQDTDNYPNENTILNDINNSEMFVNVIDKKIVGCVVLTFQKEQSYVYIYDGAWSFDENYMVIHRLAVKKEFYGKGIAKELIEYAIVYGKKHNKRSIKIDTKKENIRMISLLNKMKFIEKGKIDLLRKEVLDKVRLAFELVL